MLVVEQQIFTEPHTYLAVQKLSINTAVEITQFFFNFIDELPLWYVVTSGNNGSSIWITTKTQIFNVPFSNKLLVPQNSIKHDITCLALLNKTPCF